MTALSDMLVYLRKRKGLSQQELADKLQLTRSAISMYETGKREPDLETLEIFADFYNVDMNTLTGRGDTMPQQSSAIDIIDSDLVEYLDELRNRPEKKLLFSVTKNATKSQIEAIVRMIEEMQGN